MKENEFWSVFRPCCLFSASEVRCKLIARTYFDHLKVFIFEDFKKVMDNYIDLDDSITKELPSVAKIKRAIYQIIDERNRAENDRTYSKIGLRPQDLAARKEFLDKLLEMQSAMKPSTSEIWHIKEAIIDAFGHESNRMLSKIKKVGSINGAL